MSKDAKSEKDKEEARVGFSVDTHLFRELGELLVGRESTALIELVKNAYDADATEVTVYGEQLGDRKRGVIRVRDNGTGMDLIAFKKGFLTIASRTKDVGDRTSPRYKRRYTGAKGVGRLATHKLGSRLDVESLVWATKVKPVMAPGVVAHIDWELVERAETLDKVQPDALSATATAERPDEGHGTTLTISKLKANWTPGKLTSFVVEVQALQAPEALWKAIPKAVTAGPTLFEEATVADVQGDDPGFSVRLEGDFDTGESYWPTVLETAHWVLEIEANASGVQYNILPTKKAVSEQIVASGTRPVRFKEDHPAPSEGPFFQSRILVRSGAQKSKDQGWATRKSGIRLYVEGFRILPYGETTDDWLALNRDTTERTRSLKLLDGTDLGSELKAISGDEGLLFLPNKHYFGAVFLTTNRAPSLKVLVTREGLVPNEGYEHLVTIVRKGIALLTRVRAATRSVEITPGQPAEGTPASPIRGSALRDQTLGAIERLERQSESLEELGQHAPPEITQRLQDVAKEIKKATAVARDTIPASSLIRVLATVGTQLAAFVHEVNRLLSMASNISALIELHQSKAQSASEKKALGSIQRSVGELRLAIERQASYLSDVTSPDARRRRSAQPLREVFDVAWRLLAATAERKEIRLDNSIEPSIKTIPMFRAELVAVFTNVLTNALKAAGPGGKIEAKAAVSGDGELRLKLQNTGTAVDLSEAERWFRAFESTTTEVDPVLGQGMGLGLTITRDILVESGGSIQFIAPSRGFATALEMVFPRSKR